MLKIKTFSFEDNTIFKYNKDCGKENYDENYYRQASGEYYYIKNTLKIDRMINDFIVNNNINVVDIKINSIIVGNNPPTSILIYTIIYEDIYTIKYEESEEE